MAEGGTSPKQVGGAHQQRFPIANRRRGDLGLMQVPTQGDHASPQQQRQNNQLRSQRSCFGYLETPNSNLQPELPAGKDRSNSDYENVQIRDNFLSSHDQSQSRKLPSPKPRKPVREDEASRHQFKGLVTQPTDAATFKYCFEGTRKTPSKEEHVAMASDYYSDSTEQDIKVVENDIRPNHAPCKTSMEITLILPTGYVLHTKMVRVIWQSEASEHSYQRVTNGNASFNGSCIYTESPCWDSPERVRVLIEGIQGVAHTLYLGHFTFTDTTPTDQPTCGLPCLPTNHLAESTLRQIAMLMKQYQDILQLASGSASQNSHESTDSGLQSSKEINKLLEVFSMLTSVVPDSIQNDTGEKQPVTWYCSTQVPIDEMVTPAYADPSDIIPENKGLTAPRTVMIPGDKFIKMLEDVKHSIISCDKALEKGREYTYMPLPPTTGTSKMAGTTSKQAKKAKNGHSWWPHILWKKKGQKTDSKSFTSSSSTSSTETRRPPMPPPKPKKQNKTFKEPETDESATYHQSLSSNGSGDFPHNVKVQKTPTAAKSPRPLTKETTHQNEQTHTDSVMHTDAAQQVECNNTYEIPQSVTTKPPDKKKVAESVQNAPGKSLTAIDEYQVSQTNSRDRCSSSAASEPRKISADSAYGSHPNCDKIPLQDHVYENVKPLKQQMKSKHHRAGCPAEIRQLQHLEQLSKKVQTL
ncbi:uncharacterized protein LOC134188852 isoform X2 [Corticium candelabrum]|uniref:uncharacterized protein LOC134188852 isoform X2 n=1 Tax=Corticium candelabrum TaxID=121492 RepID=UPI002E276EF4|nr:uncharacterized protein LOC134188852 isoform X2 [Corticium candelabrum]